MVHEHPLEPKECVQMRYLLLRLTTRMLEQDSSTLFSLSLRE